MMMTMFRVLYASCVTLTHATCTFRRRRRRPLCSAALGSAAEAACLSCPIYTETTRSLRSTYIHLFTPRQPGHTALVALATG